MVMNAAFVNPLIATLIEWQPDKRQGKPWVLTAKGAAMPHTIIDRCEAKGLRMTGQRRIIGQVLQDSSDHPDVEELYARASALDAGISIATVYRTVKLFEEAGILERLEFGDGRARYEDAERDHHDHLIDMNSGEVIEFVDPEIEALQEKIAAKLGYELRGHRLELYGVPKRKE
jgi:Fur family ferric uptake transcriptional regulator